MSATAEVRTTETDVLAAYRTYEERETQRDYSPDRIGRVHTLLEREERRPPSGHPKVETVWDGPLFLDTSPDPERPFVVLMFVRDLAGKVTVENPGDIGGGETDWWLYREGIRLEMDAVGAGARTLRGSGITLSLYDPDLVRFRTAVLGKPRHPWQVLITGSGDLDPPREYLLAVPELPTIVLTSGVGADRLAPALQGRPGKHVLVIGDEPRRLNLRYGLTLLHQSPEFQIRRLLVVGGTEVSTSLLHAHLVDEVFLTGSSRLLGGAERRTFFEGAGYLPPEAPNARLTTVKIGVRDRDTLFLRYRLT